MFDFTSIPGLRLSKGDHPTPAQGVCFYEAVAFFAGEPHFSRPFCVCPVLTEYGIALNDDMPAGVRNDLLIPLIPLVAGTRDKESEQRRAEFLAMWAVNKILPIALRNADFGAEAVACENADGLSAAAEAAVAARDAANTSAAFYVANAAAKATKAAAKATKAARDAATSSAAFYVANAAAKATKAAAKATKAAAKATKAAAKATKAARDAAAWAAFASAFTATAATAANAAEVWRLAVDGLRRAALLGRHDGFQVADEELAERGSRLLALAS